MSDTLALHGGDPIRTKPWIDNITTDESEANAVLGVMREGYLSLFEGSHTPDKPFSFDGGPWVQRLEKAWGDYYGCAHVVSMNSATSGLYAAIGALNLGYGDEVIVSPYTMAACATAPLLFGAIPIFADVELESGSLSVESIASLITPRTKGILVVHQFGIPADMDGIMELAQKHDIKVIEDCAQAHGASYKGKPVGTIGDIGVFSLNVNKTIQSGEGGVCVARTAELRYRLALIRNHGEAVVGPAGYESITNIIGQNYRLTEVQAAIAVEQLKKLDGLNKPRLEMVEQLQAGVEHIEWLEPILPRPETNSTYYVFPMRFCHDKIAIKRETFIKAVNSEGISFFQGYVRPLYLQPMFSQKHAFKHGYPWSAPENRESKTNYTMGACPHAEQLHFKEMIINEHVRLPQTSQDMDDIVKAINKVVDHIGSLK